MIGIPRPTVDEGDLGHASSPIIDRSSSGPDKKEDEDV